jgi:hypothetical protein
MAPTPDSSRPRTGPGDFNEGQQAAERFKHALRHLATIPPSSVPKLQPYRKASRKKH